MKISKEGLFVGVVLSTVGYFTKRYFNRKKVGEGKDRETIKELDALSAVVPSLIGAFSGLNPTSMVAMAGVVISTNIMNYYYSNKLSKEKLYKDINFSKASLQPKIVPEESVIPQSSKKDAPTLHQGNIVGAIILQKCKQEGGTLAIVNAANKWLRGGAGVTGAIYAAGGAKENGIQKLVTIGQDALADENNKEKILNCSSDGRSLQNGKAILTNPADLTTKGVDCIIHTSAPNIGSSNPSLEQVQYLISCYKDTVDVFKEKKSAKKSILFPILGGAIYGWDDLGKRIGYLACVYLQKQNLDIDIHMIGYTSNDYTQLKKLEIEYDSCHIQDKETIEEYIKRILIFPTKDIQIYKYNIDS